MAEMKYLQRELPGPDVLAKYDYNNHTWDDVSSHDKKEIWRHLVQMQGKVCAYCERKIDLHKEGDKHIEHFKRKGIHRELTFSWPNLFGSCGEQKRCGFYKDKQKYNETELLKVDEIDPEDFFVFLYSGDVIVKEGISGRNQVMAEVTLRVFNLNPQVGGVKAERRNVIEKDINTIKGYVKIAKELIESGEDVEEVRQCVREEYYNHISQMEFRTARKHVFDAFLP